MDRKSLKENAVHGTVSFPLALYECSGNKEGRVPLHWHDEMEIIYLHCGVFSIWINTKEYVINAPAIVCVNPGELHSLVLPENCSESAVVFNLNILSFEQYDAVQAKLIRPLLDGRIKMPQFINGEDEIFHIIKGYYDEINQKIKEMNKCGKENEIEKNVSYLQIKAALFGLLSELYKHKLFVHIKEINNKDDYHIGNLKRVIGYINDNYSTVIRLEDLAELINMNSQYFCRYFKENLGKTATEYINEVRVEKAAEALIETDEKIINIAQNSGFENMGYFIRRFKKEKGVTPSEYRKNSKKSK